MNTTRLFFLITFITMGLVGCGSPATPQIIVVTATAITEATPPLPTATPTPMPTDSPTLPTVTPSLTPTEIATDYAAGTLLKGSGDGVFYLTGGGLRLHIYDWPTFLALGFQQSDIITVSDEVLDHYLLKGELSRLLMDKSDGLYWVSQGQRWLAMDLQPIIYAQDYQGPPPTGVDEAFLAQLPLQQTARPGPLLRQNDTIYYFYRDILVPLTADMVDEQEILDVPANALTGLTPQSYLPQAQTTLKADTPAANIRSGAGAEFEVIGSVTAQDVLILTGQANNWYQLTLNGQTGWIAGSLVKPNLALALLPTVAVPAAAAAATTPTPDATTTLTPRYCDLVPIRGFGTVWGNQVDVQNRLGCPSTWNGGEHATKTAVQQFEHGLMIWLESDSVNQTDPIYVFFADGTYQRFNDLGAADPTKVEAIPTGFQPINDKFSKVYWEGTGARVKERLGWATSEMTEGDGAFQQFNNGRMFWSSTLDRIFVIYDYYMYDANKNYIRVLTWEQYEDTF